MLNLIYLLNIINNAIILKKKIIKVKNINYFLLNILKKLQYLNIINFFNINLLNKKSEIMIYVNNNNNKLLLNSKIKNISKLNRFIYYKYEDLIKLRSLDHFNNYILSISNKKIEFNNNNSIVTIDEAIAKKTGGILLFKIIIKN